MRFPEVQRVATVARRVAYATSIPECFEAGEPVDMAAVQRVFDENRPSDAAFIALYQLNPQGGWRMSAFKLALLFDRMAYLA